MAEPLAYSPKIRFGPFELDVEAAELRKNRTLIKLQPQPAKVLVLLTQRAGHVVTREEIRRCVWNDATFVDFERGINFSINQIRSALADDAEKPRYIETLPRRGYRFVASVAANRAGQLESSVTAAEAPEAAPGFPTDGLPAAVTRQRIEKENSRWKSPVLGLLAVAAVLGAGYVGRSWMRRDPGPNLEKIHVTKLTDTGKVDLVAISPDGRYLCYSLRDRGGLGLWLRQLPTGSNTQILLADSISFEGLSFSPDDNYIYYVRGDKSDPAFRDLYVVPVLGGPSRLLIKDIDSPPSFSPNGNQIVYTRGMPPQNAVEIWIANADGSGTHLLATVPNTDPDFQPGATWSPDGRTIAFSLGRFEKQSFMLDAVSVSDGSVREIRSSSYRIGRPLWLPEEIGRAHV
jgi:DNA-binding winged helix-turn-helix (wHTH) protein